MGSDRPRFFVLIVLFASFLAPLTVTTEAAADDSSMGATGGSVRPVRSVDIRMDAETVQAVCFGGFAEYRVDFRFVNDGRRQKVMLGFPFASDHGNRPIGFQAWKDGHPLAVRTVPTFDGESPGADSRGYLVHEAVLAHGETMITVSYLCEPSGSAQARTTQDAYGFENHYEYWLHSGATWKDTIGRAVIRYQLADSFSGTQIDLPRAQAGGRYVPVTSPRAWTTPLPRTYQWEFADFEPTPHKTDYWRAASPYDVTLAYSAAMRRGPLDAKWTASSAAEDFGDQYLSSVLGGSLGDCWADGAPGDGAGQWLEARFRKPVHLGELRLVIGNNQYVWSFAQFARPKTMTAEFSDGTSATLHLADAPTLQRFPVDVTTDSVKLTIRTVYHGTDYPAACITAVEFGAEAAPAYAAFDALLDVPGSTGALAASAGDPSPVTLSSASRRLWKDSYEAETYACGDLIGVDQFVPFPADAAPFKEPSSMEAVRDAGMKPDLPPADLVGEAVAIDALSAWTYAIHYSSGIDLLVNTDVSHVPNRSVAAELAVEASWFDIVYVDGRKLPFDAIDVAGRTLGVARPGEFTCDSSECVEAPIEIPGQIFWRDRKVSYHLYARDEGVEMDDLMAVARSLIEPAADGGGPAAATTAEAEISRPWPTWAAVVVAALLVTGVLAAVLVNGRRSRAVEREGERGEA